MKILNYLKLNKNLVDLRYQEDRTDSFLEIFHAHQGIEFLYVHEGNGRVVIDQRIYEIEPGTLLFFRPYQPHRVQIFSSAELPYIRSMFLFEPHVIQDYLAPFPQLKELFQRIHVSGDMPQVVRFAQDEMNGLIRLHASRIGSAPASAALEMKIIFLIDFLAALLPQWKEQHKPEGSMTTTVEKMMEWIDSHYMEPFGLEPLAKAVHLSTVHVSSLFRKTTGSTITEYLTARRIRQACLLLKKGDMTVGEVSEEVGISNVSYFCQLFKRNVGLTPHQFRKLEKGNFQ